MDIKITKIISTIHFSLISLIIFITLISISFFIFLEHAIVLKEIDFLDFNVKNLHVRDDNGLILDIGSIDIKKREKKSSSGFKYKKLIKIIDETEPFISLFKSINIKSIKSDDIDIYLSYKAKKGFKLKVKGSRFCADISAVLTKKYLTANILKLDTNDKFLHVSGLILLDRADDATYAELNTTFAKRDRQNTYLIADAKGVKFNTHYLTPVTTLKEIAQFTNLHRDIRPWIIDYVKGDYPHLQKLSGYIPYDNPMFLLHTLKAKAYWSSVAYSFQKGFKAAVSKRVDLIFDNGVLKIMPRDAYFYTHKGGNTSISIDFKPKDELLSVHIDTVATLDKILLDLIKSYGIKIPVEQKSGKTDADLTIYVDLQTENITALGNFRLHESEISFHNTDYKVNSADVKIVDSFVTLKDVNISYKDLAKGVLDAKIDASKQEGKFDINLYDVNVSDELSLKSKPLHVRYNMIPDSLDRIDVKPSLWNIAGRGLHVKAISSAFNYDKLQAYIPKTDINISNSLQATVYGSADIKNMYYDFNTTLKKFNFSKLSFKDDNLHVNFNYRDNLHIICKQNSTWDYSGIKLKFSKLNSSINSDNIVIHNANFILDDDLKADIVGNFSIKDDRGSFLLKNISVENDKIGKILSHKESLPVEFKLLDNSFDILIPKFNFSLLALKEGWRLNIPDISQFSKYSTLMQDFNITKGSLHIGKTLNRNDYYFTGEIEYAYPFLVKNSTPQSSYKFFGNFDKNSTSIKINDTLNVKVDDKITLTCKDTGFNINAFANFINDHNTSESNESMTFTLNAQNSFIYFSKQRKALADTISIKAKDSDILATLVYKKGGAIFQMHMGEFYLFGKHFSDVFMNHFLSLSKYRGGDFSFAVRGNIDKFKGVARIDNSRIKDYVLLNNVLAFINTIPSLASFALPNYAKNGIMLKEAYAAFEYEDKIMHFNAVKFDSGEVDIYGKGDADYLNDKINIKLNLKTHLGKNVSKLPVVGYILVGDDGSAATAFNITGRLSNPTVDTALAKDIVVAPFNILKRTIVYPFHLIKKLIDEDNATKELNPTQFFEK